MVLRAETWYLILNTDGVGLLSRNLGPCMKTSENFSSGETNSSGKNKPVMASITMTASFLGVSSALKQCSTPARRGVVMSKAVQAPEMKYTTKEETSPKRRDLVFAAAAVAVCSISNIAMADEPQRGTEEAKKKYAPICVTMPTARICHK